MFSFFFWGGVLNRYLDKFHDHKYMVYNLCAERAYVATKFDNRGASLSPPSLQMFSSARWFRYGTLLFLVKFFLTLSTVPVRLFPFPDHNAPPLNMVFFRLLIFSQAYGPTNNEHYFFLLDTWVLLQFGKCLQTTYCIELVFLRTIVSLRTQYCPSFSMCGFLKMPKMLQPYIVKQEK